MTLADALVPADRTQALHALSVVALLLLVAPFVAYAVPQLVGATGSYIVVSNSMNAEPAPTLATGDVVFVYERPPEQIQVGDVITYRSGEGMVTTHRVVGINDQEGLYFRTKGDANEEADPSLVPAARVVGTVEFTIPFLGRVLTMLGTTKGIVLFVIVPSALLVALELLSLVRQLPTEDDAADVGGEEP